MAESAEAEQFNKAGLTAFIERRDEDSPVVMLNLLAFKPDGGRERYEEYGAAVAPLLERVGGRIVYAAEPADAVIGEESWDLVILVEYPTRQAFLEMTSSPEYLEIAHLRTEALSRGELHPMERADQALAG